MKREIIPIDEKIFEGKETFLDYLDISELTLRAYKNGIECFFEYLKTKNVSKPTRNDFKAFRDTLKQTMATNTINSYITANRALFRYLEANHLYENITKDVKHLKTSKLQKTQVLTQEQCKEIYSSLTDKREKCIFGLMITTCLRANEIATAKIENIKMFNNELVLYVKCKKRDDESEYVKLCDQVANDILEYIEQRTNGNIFVSTSNNNLGKGLSDTSIRTIIKGIFKRFGIDEDWFSCHACRKTGATIAYMNGQSIYDIQQVLHHSSVQTTARYIQRITRDTNKTEYEIANAIF